MRIAITGNFYSYQCRTTYYVLVTGFGTATGAFTLTRTCAPAIPNDLCTGALPLGCGATVTGTTVGATTDAATLPVLQHLNTAPGVWYTFVGNGATNTLTMCVGTAYDSKIGVFTGTCAAWFVLQAMMISAAFNHRLLSLQHLEQLIMF